VVCVCDGARACLAMYLQHETAVTCAFGAKRRAHGALALGAGVCDSAAINRITSSKLFFRFVLSDCPAFGSIHERDGSAASRAASKGGISRWPPMMGAARREILASGIPSRRRHAESLGERTHSGAPTGRSASCG
jgi:hypothetical protein